MTPEKIRRAISIHSLRVEGDRWKTTPFWTDLQFQSTPSVWRETKIMAEATTVPAISIHSLRVEGDAEGADMKNKKESISIHSLRVEGDSKIAQLSA